jgi:hypothetical protein
MNTPTLLPRNDLGTTPNGGRGGSFSGSEMNRDGLGPIPFFGKKTPLYAYINLSLAVLSNSGSDWPGLPEWRPFEEFFGLASEGSPLPF